MIDSARTQVQTRIEALCDLEYSQFGAECIAFVRWCEEDAPVKPYQHRIAQSERKPILAEYLAAEQWIENRDHRQAEEAMRAEARTACERLATEV